MTHLFDETQTIPDAHQSDYDAIAEVIRADTLAFQREDFDAWIALWVQDDRARDVCISMTAGLSVLEGWDEIAAHMRRVLDRNLSCKLQEFGQQNLRVSVTGDTAWATFDGWSVFGNGERGDTFETRILERHDGQWKFVYSSFVLRQNEGPGGLAVGLDQKGHIVQSTQAGLDALKDHPYLTISAGRVRAHRRDWDRALQQAFDQAGRHHGFFETHRFASEMGGPAHYPVILGQTDDGGVAVVHFSIRDCLTYVWIDVDQLLDRRLGYARTVFALSEGQIKVARQIALGQSLKGSAENLGISVNTARTHLSRLYEKTGVSTQAALVRLLLSVG